jgi:hypothetical protein
VVGRRKASKGHKDMEGKIREEAARSRAAGRGKPRDGWPLGRVAESGGGREWDGRDGPGYQKAAKGSIREVFYWDHP